MAEIKGALIVCDRCNLSAFTKLGDYDRIETPRNWHKVNFGPSLSSYNLCPYCYDRFEIAKSLFFSEEERTQIGVIELRDKDGK